MADLTKRIADLEALASKAGLMPKDEYDEQIEVFQPEDYAIALAALLEFPVPELVIDLEMTLDEAQDTANPLVRTYLT
jgi:hypothetical protein